ncbi:hypothetical protein E2C01_098800 [Portunus trituberculatus]|uniref:Uncharacterized protein n=1 Tax=Portunus trituberculatus TaxID=210409 RepID=A0A5B7KF22_PORTR|nr:hypothetical protein [Portunus trituberculatus]
MLQHLDRARTCV